MAKLQQIKRANGSKVNNVNIPLNLIELLGWEKGDNLELKVEQLSIESSMVLIISRSVISNG